MKNLSKRFILAGLVTGFTYLAFITNMNNTANERSLSLVKDLKEEHVSDSLTLSIEVEHVRKLNYGMFRKSLLRHRSINYT